MTWFKENPETGELINGGLRVEGPGFSLGENGGEGADGWYWSETNGTLVVKGASLIKWEQAMRSSSVNTIAEVKAANLEFIEALKLENQPT